jgi:hypothetical protein
MYRTRATCMVTAHSRPQSSEPCLPSHLLISIAEHHRTRIWETGGNSTACNLFILDRRHIEHSGPPTQLPAPLSLRYDSLTPTCFLAKLFSSFQPSYLPQALCTRHRLQTSRSVYTMQSVKGRLGLGTGSKTHGSMLCSECKAFFDH